MALAGLAAGTWAREAGLCRSGSVERPDGTLSAGGLALAGGISGALALPFNMTVFEATWRYVYCRIGLSM